MTALLNQMTTLTAIVQNQQENIKRLKQRKSKAGKKGLISGLKIAVNDVDDEEEEEIEKAPETNEKKKKSEKRYESSSNSESKDKRRDKQRKSRVRAERENLHIPVSGLLLQMNALESDRIAAASITDCVKQSGFFNAYVQNSSTFRGDTRRNRFEAESLARTIDLVFNEMGWKAVVMKTFLEVTVRQILALEVGSGNNMDEPWNAVRDIEENHRAWSTQQTTEVNKNVKGWNLKPPYRRMTKKIDHLPGRKKVILRETPFNDVFHLSV